MRDRLIRLLSVLPTPLLVLGSAHELYLRNQEELEGVVTVLVPFWQAALLAVALGVALTALSRRGFARIALWAYHGVGASFLAYSFLRALPFGGYAAAWTLDQAASVPAALAAAVVVLALLSRRDPEKVAAPLAVFAVVLLAQESWRLGTRLSAPPPPPVEAVPVLKDGDPSLPNVYHLVLDAFEPSLFDRTWPASVPLDGFVYFTQARALFGATVPSMASVFTSRRPTGAGQPLEAALSADVSLPRRLRAAGYQSMAYLPPNVYPASDAFDPLVWHAAVLPRAEAAALHRWLFVRLWLATVAPAGLIDFMSGRDAFGFAALDMRSLRNQRVSVLTQPVTTLLSFERYLDHESRLPARGRYTLVHLLVPHSPFVLAPDCTHRDIRSATNELDQSRCAVRLIRRLLDRLDQLGRLRDSIVLIQSDHGSFTERPGHTPEDYPALLLLKPQHASGPLRRVNTAVSLLDVTPTLLGLLGLEASPLYQGRTLLDAGPRPSS